MRAFYFRVFRPFRGPKLIASFVQIRAFRGLTYLMNLQLFGCTMIACLLLFLYITGQRRLWPMPQGVMLWLQ